MNVSVDDGLEPERSYICKRLLPAARMASAPTLWRHRDFLLWLGQSVSRLGDQFTGLAIPGGAKGSGGRDDPSRPSGPRSR